MQTDDPNAPRPNKVLFWVGAVLSVLPSLMLLMAGVMNLLKPPSVIEGTVKLGYPESVITGLGIVLLTCTVLYLIPRTAVLGAILLTGWLGGAVASHVRNGDEWSHILTPAIFGAILWLGLYLRDVRLRALVPLRS